MDDRLQNIFDKIEDEDISKQKAKQLLKVHKRVKNNLYSSQKVFEIISHRMIEDIMKEHKN